MPSRTRFRRSRQGSPPARRRSRGPPIRHLARILIRAYHYSFSAILGRQCRYLPTCSEYTEGAVMRYGVWRGLWMGAARIARCRPGGHSGFDPVPETLPASADWWRPWRYGDWSGRHIRVSLDKD